MGSRRGDDGSSGGAVFPEPLAASASPAFHSGQRQARARRLVLPARPPRLEGRPSRGRLAAPPDDAPARPRSAPLGNQRRGPPVLRAGPERRGGRRRRRRRGGGHRRRCGRSLSSGASASPRAFPSPDSPRRTSSRLVSSRRPKRKRRPWAARFRKDGWGAGSRTPIGRSRVCSPTIGRPPNLEGRAL